MRKEMTTTRNIEWRILTSGDIEGTNGEHDFVISSEAGDVILGVFDADNSDSDDAHVEGLPFESIDEAKEAAESYAA
jgi:hypothetical protein